MADDVKTQGTHLYFVNPTGPALVKLECPTGISGLGGGDVDQIENTCLDETDEHTFVEGLSSRDAVTVPFNMRPAAASHQLLFDFKDQAPRPIVHWMALLSESDDPPVFTALDGTMEPPDTRSAISFDGVVTNVVIDIATNEIVRGTLTIQRRSPLAFQWYVPA